MALADSIRIGIFIAIVVVVLVSAARTAIRLIGGAEPRSWKTDAILAVAFLGIVCIAYGRLVEPYWLSVTRLALESTKIPKGSHIRIAHISDIHSDSAPRLENRLAEVMAAEHPDVIVFTGDSINSREGLPVFKTLMQKLRAVAPTFAVKGNWDVSYWEDLGLFEGTGAVELDGSARLLEIRGVKIGIAGVASGNLKALPKALGALPKDVYSIFLFHHPDLINEVAARDIDLYCAGHTHGGQVALPFYGALVTFSKYGKQFESGLFREGKTMFYVNRGLGMEGGMIPRFRFLARPELTIIDVTAPGSAQVKS